MSATSTDLLLAHAYFLAEDEGEQKVMKPYPPLGVLYLTAWMRRAGARVEVFDGTFQRLGDFDAVLARNKAPVVGFYANMMTRRFVLQLVAKAKAAGRRVVVGGPDPANYRQEYLIRGVDVIVVGEGELTMEELWPRLVAGDDLAPVAGVAYLRAGEVVSTPARTKIRQLDVLPTPARDAIDIPRYLATWRRHHGKGPVSLITSRGCPFTCRWCSHAVYGTSHRQRTPGHVADEVEEILGRYGPDMVWYADDVFTLNRKWFMAYADELDRRGLHVPFETITRADRLDEEVVRRLADMKAWRIWVGSESGSQRILNAMDRKTDADDAVAKVHMLRRAGIQAGMFVMVGYEGETIDDIKETARFLAEASPDTFLTTLAYPIAGTPYHADVGDRARSLKAWEDGSDKDITVAGRHSRRFYDHAQKWIGAEVALRQARGLDRPNPLRIAKRAAKAGAMWAAMQLTQHEREEGRP